MRKFLHTATFVVTLLAGAMICRPAAQDYVKGWATITGPFSVSGTLASNGSFVEAAGGVIFWNTRAVMESQADGHWSIENNAQTIGARIKVDSLPTVGSGFGTSPAVIAGSTPFAGSVNVGTGGVATSGVITFNGTAFPSAPFCVASTGTANNFPVNVTPTTTQVTLVSGAAWPASILVSWICVSAK